MFISRKEYERLKELEYQSMTEHERHIKRIEEKISKNDKFTFYLWIGCAVVIAALEIISRIIS